MHTILLIGEDTHLLDTRAALLADVANIIIRTPAAEAASPTDGPFDLVVLCHSLDEDVRHDIVRSVHKTWPNAKLLQMEPNFGDHLPTEADAVTITAPKQLLKAVKAML